MFNFLEELSYKRLAHRLMGGRDFHLVYDTFLWDLICKVRKVGRILRKLPSYFKLLVEDEDWDYAYVLELLKLKLTRMATYLGKHSQHTCKDKNVREIKTVISHIEHYLDLHKYSPSGNIDMEMIGGTEEDAKRGIGGRLKFNKTKRDAFLANRFYELEKWHWSCIWDKISRKGCSWWYILPFIILINVGII